MEPKLEQEHITAIEELTGIIGKHGAAFNKLAKSYGAPYHTDLHDQVAQAIYLMQKHDDFEKRFENEVVGAKGFDLGKIFQGIKKAFQVVGKIFSPIVNAIKKAVAKHKAASAPPPPKKDDTGKKPMTTWIIVGVATLIVIVVSAVLFLPGEKKKAA